jgi:hypothetical protein
MKEIMEFTVSDEPMTMANGEVLTEADFERMADEAEHAEIDVERLLDRARRGVGRPSLGEGMSPIAHIRFDETTRRRLAEAAEADHTTPSAIVREAVQAWLKDRPHAVGE